MKPKLKTTVTRKTNKKIHLEISKDNFEIFCDAAGLFRKEVINHLNNSEKEHKKGQVAKRKSLSELL